MNNRWLIAILMWLPSTGLLATQTFVEVLPTNAAPTSSETILDLSLPLALEETDANGIGLDLTQRRETMDLVDTSGTALSFNASDADLSDLSNLAGSADYYLYKYLPTDTTLSSNTMLGTTGGAANKPLLLDLGEQDLTVNGNLEGQGVHYITRVNSFASSAGLVMDGSSGLGVDASRTGQVIAQELIEQTSGTTGNFKIVLDLNSSFANGANFVVAEETAGTAGNTFSYNVTDAENSYLLDNSYVINSAAVRSTTGNNEKVTVTFSRANDEYIQKSNTNNHQANDAALKLGTIAADGVALGDLQTVLTKLDINAYGYGNNAENLATEVKRLAPIANHSAMIAAYDSTALVDQAIEQRFTIRRGNWTGYSDLRNKAWFKLHQQATTSSGSVPVATSGAQDTAGHNGFKTNTNGITAGLDHRFDGGLIGLSSTQLSTDIEQLDDRQGEKATQEQKINTIYGRVNNRFSFLNLVASFADGDLQGSRKSALDRVANYQSTAFTREASIKAGHRFDLSDGRSAVTPYYRLAAGQYQQNAYTETGAGDLSLDIHAYKVRRVTQELGAEISHKGRYFGIKGLSSLNLSMANERLLDNADISANYTGATHTNHSGYTTFVTPAERWSEQVVKFRGMLQLEPWHQTLVRMGVDIQARNSRQSVAVDFAIVKTF